MKKIVILLMVILLTSCNQQHVEVDQEVSKSKEVIVSNLLYERYRDIKLIGKLAGNTKKVWTLDASTKGTFVSGGEDSSINVWDSETLALIASNSDHDRLVEEIEFLESGSILSIGDDNKLRYYDPISKVSKVMYEGKTSEFNINTDNSKLVISNGNEKAVLYDIESFDEISTVFFTDGCFDVRLSSDDKYLFSVGHNGKVQKWSLESGELLTEYNGLRNDVHSLEITSDSKHIVAAGTDMEVYVWDIETAEVVSKYYHSDGLYDLDVSADGKLIASVGCDKQVILAELSTGKILQRLRHDDEIHAVTIDPDGNYLVAGGYDGYVYVWGFEKLDTDSLQQINSLNASDIELILELKDHKDFVFDVDISSDDKLIASAERGDVIKVNIWSVENCMIIQSFELDQAPIVLKFTKDGKKLLCKGEMGNLYIWDIEKEEIVFSSFDKDDEIFGVDISSDDEYLVTGSRHGDIKIWDFKTMEILRATKVDDEFIMNVEFSPDDDMIFYSYAGATKDFATHALNFNDFSPIYKTEGHRGYNYMIDIAVESKLLATAGADNRIKLWDLDTGDHIKTLEGHMGKVMDIDFSLLQDLIISGSAHDYTIRLWDVDEGKELKVINAGEEVQCVEMSNSGKFFITAGEKGNISIWGIKN